MKKVVTAEYRKRLLLSFLSVGLIASLGVAPSLLRSQAAGGRQDQTTAASKADQFANYDIRTDKQSANTIAKFRAANRDQNAVSKLRQKMFAGEADLKTRVANLKIEYNPNLLGAEVIAPDLNKGFAALTKASTAKRAEILRSFVKQNDQLLGLNNDQADGLKVTADYTNPDGQLSFAHLAQSINGVPVFAAEVKAGFTKRGEMFRVINNLAPALDAANLSTDFGAPETAVQNAFKYVSRPIQADDLQLDQSNSTDLKAKFGKGEFTTVAEKFYFPTEPGVARAAWRVIEWQSDAAFMTVVDAETGALLWRKNLQNDQTQPVTYNVYNDKSPQPYAPGPLSPDGSQGTPIGRTSITLIGNEAPNTFNNLGWMTDGTNTTDGNNVQAGIDRDGVNGVDYSATGSGNRVFNFDYTPDTSVTVGQNALDPVYQNGVVTNLFYWTNTMHDRLYRIGFTEAAGNFQTDNFGRGGGGSDRLSAEAQDSSGANNANMATPPDGFRPRMQMYIFPGGAALRDGDLDNEVILHEYTHGLSNRLHNNGSGLLTNQSAGMGEGWSDFYARVITAKPSEPLDGVYTAGSYVAYKLGSNVNLGTFVNNGFYGIRRFPYVLRSVTGPNGKPLDPLTLKDIDPTQTDLTRGAYPKNPILGGGGATEVHNAGEVWCSTLNEIRAKFIRRLGFEAGTVKTLQTITDGMKLAPTNPTFIQERNAIIAGARASGTAADVEDLWQGFAIRGLGYSAQDINPNLNSVTEAFDVPNALPTNVFTVSDASGNNNGYPEPGETVTLTLPLINQTGDTTANVSAQVVGGNTVSYGDLVNGASATKQIAYTIPAGATCGGYQTITLNINSTINGFAHQTQITRQIFVGVPQFTGGTTQNFDSLTAPALPVGWQTAQTGATGGFVTRNSGFSSSPNVLYVPDPTTLTYAEASTLINVTSASAQLAFKLNYNTEPTWDGSVLEVKIAGNDWQDITAAGGSFASGGYNDIISENAGHPLAGRKAWTGNSNGFVNVAVNLPASANNQTVGLRFRHGSDLSVGGIGTFIDDVQLTGATFIGGYNCAANFQGSKARVDFDGDGKTDVSVYRGGTWYELNSKNGFAAAQFGLSTDTVLSGDFDGDGKADLAVVRNNNGNLNFFVLNSQNNTFSATTWGTAGDVPAIGDYNGDGRDDVAVFRPSTGVWYVQPTGGGNPLYYQFGQADDVPVAFDYDGDGKVDYAVFRPSNNVWYIQQSRDGFKAVQFGSPGDKLVPADYDKDGKKDIAVFRNGTWFILRSSNNQVQAINFGQAGDVPVPGDYDGDGADDAAVFRNGVWYINGSTNGFSAVQFGLSSDTPVASAYTR